MKDKKQDGKALEELVKAADAFSDFMINLADELAKALSNIKVSKEEDTWEMKCPYEIGDKYYIVNPRGSVKFVFWNGCVSNEKTFNQGNTFPTKEEAELEAKRRNLLTRFRAFRNECNGDWKPDWSEQDSKYFLCYSQKFDILSTNDIHICERFHTFGYFKTESDARKSIKLFGDEIIELFVKSEGGENENNQRNKRR